MGNTSKSWIIIPIKISICGEWGWCREGDPGSSKLSTHSYGEGPQQVWIDPSTLLVPVGHNTKGFGLCCFATVAVCSLVLPAALYSSPSFHVSGHIHEIQASFSFSPVQCYFIAKSRWLGIVWLTAGRLVNPKGCGLSAYQEPFGSKYLSVLREKQAGPTSGCFLCINVFPLWYLVSCF